MLPDFMTKIKNSERKKERKASPISPCAREMQRANDRGRDRSETN